MAEKSYIVRFQPPELSVQPVTAASAEVQGEHLVFLDTDGKLVALFLLEVVEGWDEL